LRRLQKTVLIDCEPVGLSSQVLRLAPMIDGVLFVVEAGRERRATVARAVLEMRQAHLPLLGVIVN